MRAEGEGAVMNVGTPQIERVRIRKPGRVTIRSPQQQKHKLPFLQNSAPELKVFCYQPAGGLYRAVEAEQLLDCRFD